MLENGAGHEDFVHDWADANMESPTNSIASLGQLVPPPLKICYSEPLMYHVRGNLASCVCHTFGVCYMIPFLLPLLHIGETWHWLRLVFHVRLSDSSALFISSDNDRNDTKGGRSV